MKEIKPNKQYKPDFIPKPKQGLPMENVGGNWILTAPIQTPDYIFGKTGFRLDPLTLYSKIFAFGGNLTQYDAIVSQDGSGQYKTIQDAIAAGKKRIYVRSGEYLISVTIALATTKILLVGENKNDTTIKIADGANINAITVTDNNCEIRDIKIDGNKANNSSSGTGIYLNSADECTVDNCFITDCDNIGINVAGDKNNIINNIVTACDSNGIAIAPLSMDNIVTNNQSFSNGANGILILTSGGNRIANNLFLSNTNSGIAISYVQVPGNNNIISSNFCKDNTEHGIVCLSENTVIIGNSLFSNDLSGLSLSNLSPYSVITGNMFFFNKKNGIDVAGADYCAITGNTFHNNGQLTNDAYSDVLLQGTSTYNTITGNTFISDDTNKVKYCIREDSSADDYNIISSNVAQGAVTTNISIQGANTIKSLNQE